MAGKCCLWHRKIVVYGRKLLFMAQENCCLWQESVVYGRKIVVYNNNNNNNIY